jgi:hypothetical protein
LLAALPAVEAERVRTAMRALAPLPADVAALVLAQAFSS